MQTLLKALDILGADAEGKYVSPRGDVISDIWKFFPNYSRQDVSMLLSMAKKRGVIDKPTRKGPAHVEFVQIVNRNAAKTKKRGRKLTNKATPKSDAITALKKQVDELVETVTALKNEVFTVTMASRIEKATNLTVMERELLNMRFGIDAPVMTLEQVSEVFGLSKQALRQMELRAIEKVRP